MQELEVNGKKVSVPTMWSEVTLSQYSKLVAVKDEIDCASIFLGIESDVLRKAKDIEGFNRVMIALYFLKEKMNAPKVDKLTTISFRGKELVAKDISSIMIAQLLDIKVIASKAYEDPNEMYANVLAMYLYPLVSDKEYSFSNAQELLPEIWEMPAVQIISLVGFFLSGLTKSKKSKKRGLFSVAILKKNLLRGLRG